MFFVIYLEDYVSYNLYRILFVIISIPMILSITILSIMICTDEPNCRLYHIPKIRTLLTIQNPACYNI